MLKAPGKVTRSQITIAVLITLFVLGSIPWESLFSLELRDENLIILADGLLAGISLTGLFGYLFYLVMKSGMRNQFLPMLILFLAFGVSLVFTCLATIFYPDPWKDVLIYKSANEYIIVQFNAFGITGDRTEWRMIKTESSPANVRMIEHIKVKNLRQQLILPEFPGEYVHRFPVIKTLGKTWYLHQE